MKTKRIQLALSVLFSLVVICAIAGAAPEKLKVLLIDGQNNHNWKSQTPILKPALEMCGLFTVDVSTTPAKKAPKADWDNWKPDFSKYDVILSNYNGQMWPESVCKDFEEYMKNGGGLALTHAADNAFGKWDEYNKMIGLGGWGGRNEKSGPYVYWNEGEIVRDMKPGGGGTHGPQREYTIETRQPNHPIMKGLPTSWMHTRDELYANLRGPGNNMTILATALSAKTKKHEPILLTITYGEGRVFHDVLGHADYSMKCVGFITTLQRGCEWAATGKVTIPVPENFPGPSKSVVLDPTK
jgi:type 1 glutamine amidotransferase